MKPMWKLPLPIALSLFSAGTMADTAEDLMFSDNSNANEVEEYTFNDNFIMGSHNKANLDKYTSTALAEGVYSLDVYTNGAWRGRYDLRVEKQKNGKMDICYSEDMLNRFGISTDRLNSALAKNRNFCGTLAAWNADKDIKGDIDKAALRLDISIPQIYEDQQFKGYVDPSMWDTGIPALNVGWNGNVWNSHYSSTHGVDSTTGYLGVNATATIGGWALKHRGNMAWSDKNGSKWNSSSTYLEKAIPGINSVASVGQVNGTGLLFDTITVKGIDLKTDSAMYPDGAMQYTPEIRGEARTNALVTVRQNGNIIHQVTVAPGPFNLSNINATGYGSDLEVSVKEADGSVNTFTVGFNATSRLLRPGMFSYELLAGKPDSVRLVDKPIVYQGTAQYGFNNYLTGYAGASGFENYQSFLLGGAVNTPIGGVSFDVTTSALNGNDGKDTGKMYRATFSRNITQTQTNVGVTATKYDSKDFYNLSDALERNDGGNLRQSKEKSSLSLNVSQALPDGWGNLYANARLVKYWNDEKKNTQYQIGYTNRLGIMSYGITAQRSLYKTGDRSRFDDRISLNFSFPLDLGMGNRSTVTSMTNFDNSHYAGTSVGLNGTVGEYNEFSYGLNASTGDSKYVAGNASYKTSMGTVGAGFSQSSSYRQTSLSGSGSVIVHGGGVTLTPESGDTLVLVEAKDAAGAHMGSSGAQIDSRGYGVSSAVRPYRVNKVELNPKGANEDVYFNETMKQAVPYKNSVVKITFDTEKQDNVLLTGKLADGTPLPFGASIYNLHGKEIGMVAQGGVAHITDASSPAAVIKMDKGECQFTIPNSNKGEITCK